VKKKDCTTRNVVTRRDFIKGTAYGTLGVALGLKGLERGAGAAETGEPFAAKNPLSRVVLIRDAAAVDANHEVNPQVVAKMIQAALKTFADGQDMTKFWGKLIRPEDTVGIKFSRCNWTRVPTEQAVIDAVVAQVSKTGVAKERILAADGGLPVDKCTALINVSSIKVHGQTGIAVSIKNYINFTGKESSYHHSGSSKLGEAWQLPQVKGKTKLIVVDALRPYFGPGPQVNPMYRWDYKGILVGTDPVALDTVSLSLCQKKRDLFKKEPWPISPPPISISTADTEYRLGTSDPRKIKLIRMGWEKDRLV